MKRFLMDTLNGDDKISEVVRFLIAGGICFVFEILTLWALVELCRFYYLYASAIAFTAALLINYVICRRWVFSAAHASAGSFALFAISSVAGLGLNQLTMWAMVDICGIWYILAKVIAAGVVTIWNFVMKRYALTGI